MKHIRSEAIMRYYYLKPLRKGSSGIQAVLSVTPATLNLGRAAPDNVATLVASLDQDPGSAVPVSVASSDPSVTVSPASFNLGGGNPINRSLTVTGTVAGPDAVTLTLTAPGQTPQNVAIARPPVPLDLAVSPSSLVLDRVAPNNAGSFTASLNRVPDSPVLVSIGSSDASVTVFPASFSLSTGNPPSRGITVTGSPIGPNSVTISVNPLGLPTRPVAVTRPNFQPGHLTGLALWFDVDDSASLFTGTFDNRLTSTTPVSANGDLVCRIADKSGNGRHATCTSDAGRGAWTVSTLNGRNGIALGSYSMAPVTTNPVTWYVVHRWNGTTNDSRLVNNNNVNGISLGHSSLSGSTVAFVREGITWTNSGFSPGTTYRIYRVEFANPNSSYWTVETGSEVLRQSLSLTGSTNALQGFSTPGHLFEMLRYDRVLTSAEKTAVESYLRQKWGTP